MVKIISSLCLILIFNSCVRTVVKYDQFGLPSETTSFKRKCEKDDLAEKIGNIPPFSEVTCPAPDHFEHLVCSLRGKEKPKRVENYSDIVDDPAYLERFINLLVRERQQQPLSPPVLRVLVEKDIHPDVPEGWRPKSWGTDYQETEPILRFVHLSDVQLRDENVKLVSHFWSKFLDSFVDSVERNPSQEYFDSIYYLALVLKINALKDKYEPEPKLQPKFMIHTGDATDVRTAQELYPFVYISNFLRMPWFNAVGNHDAATLGNFNNRRCFFRNAGYSFLSTGNLFHFMLMHGPTYIHNDFPLTPSNVHEDITWKEISYFHGFDLCDKAEVFVKLDKSPQGASFPPESLIDKISYEAEDHSLSCKGIMKEEERDELLKQLNASDPAHQEAIEAVEKLFARSRNTKGAFERVCKSPGYYSLELKDTGIRLIVLNTATPLLEENLDDKEYIRSVTHSTTPKQCYKGKIDKWQLGWLEKELVKAKDKGELVLVFGHHPLEEEVFVDDSYNRLIEIFCHLQNVVAYFCGHTHEQKVRFIHHPANKERGFWEINPGSILEYPQEGNLITLYDLRNGYLRINVQNLGVFKEEDDCKDCKNFKNPLEYMACLAHAGAKEDWTKDINRNNYILYFPIKGWQEPTQNPSPIPQPAGQEIKLKKEKEVADTIISIIKHKVTYPDSLTVKGEGEKGFWRFHVETDKDKYDDMKKLQELFEKDPFLYRTLAYLIEMAGEEEKETWQLVKER